LIRPGTNDETVRFRHVVCQRIGLHFDDAKIDYLAAVLQRRIETCGRGSAAYLWELEYEPSGPELSALARELTVGETYFFRNHEQFEAFAEIVLPERIAMRAQQKTLRLLSAGCSTGEEAYSMGIVARETILDPSWKVSIRAVDINPVALEKARRARYSPWALRETPKDVLDRWFRADGREMALSDTARATVAFEEANLASDDPDLWQPAAYDAVFCRNVLMYFEPTQMRGVIERIARSLAPGGFLFLGHAETLRGISNRFLLCNSHGTFYYRLGGEAQPHDKRCSRLEPARPSSDASHPLQDTAWFDAIRVASERVATLLPSPDVSHQPAQSLPTSLDWGPILELLRKERFAEALLQLRGAAEAVEPDVLLHEAALLVQCGELRGAEDAASRLLAIEPGSAGAHYVLALCREHDGLGDRAAEQHRLAARLDPTFAMPRLHLGLLARGGSDREAARREFASALRLLEREHASRLLLFGGGFSREALMTLCESAVKNCGGRA
jgi:chemotaxis protein methyltransferase CheR